MTIRLCLILLLISFLKKTNTTISNHIQIIYSLTKFSYKISYTLTYSVTHFTSQPFIPLQHILTFQFQHMGFNLNFKCGSIDRNHSIKTKHISTIHPTSSLYHHMCLIQAIHFKPKSSQPLIHPFPPSKAYSFGISLLNPTLYISTIYFKQTHLNPQYSPHAKLFENQRRLPLILAIQFKPSHLNPPSHSSPQAMEYTLAYSFSLFYAM